LHSEEEINEAVFLHLECEGWKPVLLERDAADGCLQIARMIPRRPVHFFFTMPEKDKILLSGKALQVINPYCETPNNRVSLLGENLLRQFKGGGDFKIPIQYLEIVYACNTKKQFRMPQKLNKTSPIIF
jgi:hypothetical protein